MTQTLTRAEAEPPVRPERSSGSMRAFDDDSTMLANLQLIAEGVKGIAGFGVAAIRMVRGEDLEMVAATDSEGIGTRIPLQLMLDELAVGEHWGSLRFVAHDAVPQSDQDAQWVVPDFEASDDPDAWHPLDMLVAPLYDDRGRLLGTLAIDEPEDGRIPGPERRGELEKYAALTCRALVATVEREQLARQVEMADRVRTILRSTSAHLSPADLVRESERALTETFDIAGMWLQTFGEDGVARLASPEGVEIEMPDDLVALATGAADHCWRRQQILVLGADAAVPDFVDEAAFARCLTWLADLGIASVALAPLGSGPECLGLMALTRGVHQPAWTDIERQAFLDIGQDLGRSLSTAQTFARARGLVTELQALDVYKSQVIATISHELKNPLAAISGYLEMLQEGPTVTPPVRRSLDAMGRSTERMSRLVQNLLLLSKVGNPENRLVAVPVEIDAMVADIVEVFRIAAAEKDVDITVRTAGDGSPHYALGAADELDKVVLNLLSNAVKFSPEGGTVRVETAAVDGGVQVTVSDEGVGISEKDQKRLFEAFFRSDDPIAHLVPGTGLGLTIVGSIVSRHEGQVEVRSAPGRGTSFVITLPAAPL